jgi:hypothetical protein
VHPDPHTLTQKYSGCSPGHFEEDSLQNTGICPLKPNKDAPKTLAKPVDNSKHKNLTTHDWLNGFAYKDDHPNESQENINSAANIQQNELLYVKQITLDKAWGMEPK